MLQLQLDQPGNVGHIGHIVVARTHDQRVEALLPPRVVVRLGAPQRQDPLITLLLRFLHRCVVLDQLFVPIPFKQPLQVLLDHGVVAKRRGCSVLGDRGLGADLGDWLLGKLHHFGVNVGLEGRIRGGILPPLLLALFCAAGKLRWRLERRVELPRLLDAEWQRSGRWLLIKDPAVRLTSYRFRRTTLRRPFRAAQTP